MLFPGAAVRLLRCGPFVVRLLSQSRALDDDIDRLYAHHPAPEDDGFADFHIAIERPRSPRRWFRRQVRIRFDATRPFNPFPAEQAICLFEWGLNWAITTTAHQFIVIHAACIEKDGVAVVMPGTPGSGKSTLCAALVFRGWRLLSDELTLLSPGEGAITGLARPISLKNESIRVIADFVPDAVFSRPVHDTQKGTVALLRPPPASTREIARPGQPGFLVFPRFSPGAPAGFAPRSKGSSLIELARNAFNYDVHGRAGFEALAGMIDRCGCHDFRYGGDLDEAVEAFAALLRGAAQAPPPTGAASALGAAVGVA
ncbi:MAG: HprK-related kinase A [Alphaproteobacteria bacterium]|nr:HprK-related kinase A [Alphaproteobacteria bacterium]